MSVWQAKLCWAFCQLIPQLPTEYTIQSLIDYVEGVMIRLKTQIDEEPSNTG